MLKKIANPLVVSMIALLPMMSACSSDSSKSETTASETKAPVKESTATPDFDYKLEPKQVSENVWCFFGALEIPTKENGGNMVNTCYIKGNEGYILWDTGPSYIYAKQAYEAVSKVAGNLPVKHILLSHEHDDHWLGNNYYKEVHGAEIVGPESINKNYHVGETESRMFKTLSENAIRGTKVIHVDKWYKEPIKLTVDGVDFEYIPVGNAHSIEDYFVYMPKNKLALTGDIVMNGRVTSNRDGSVVGQLAAIEAINSKPWTTLIPGHGFIIDKTATDEYKLYFTLMKERVQKAMDDGVDETGIVEAVPLEEFKDKALYDLLHNVNVARAYTEFDVGL
ncbi:MAG: cyclase [Campylobacterota bacterium]|nr:cyclase [Campylobacterota bacterium]